MPLDPRIILQGRGVELGDPLQQYGNALQIKGAQQAQAMNALQMQRLQDADARENAGRNALRKFYGAGSRTEDLGALAQEAPDAYAAEVKRQQDLAKDKASTDKDATAAAKARAENAAAQLSNIGNMLGTVKDQASYAAVYQQALRTYGPEAIAQIPPQYDPQTVAAIRNSSLSLAQEITNRLQARNAATGERNAATAEGRLQIDRDAPKGVVVQTDTGPQLADPRTGAARPITGADGKPVGTKATVQDSKQQQSLRTNMAKISAIDRRLNRLDTALTTLSGDKVSDTGPVDQYMSRFKETGQEVQSAAESLRPLLTALTRVPGIGSQSDLEARLDSLQYPGLDKYGKVNKNTMTELRSFVKDLRAAYESAGTGGVAGGGAEFEYTPGKGLSRADR